MRIRSLFHSLRRRYGGKWAEKDILETSIKSQIEDTATMNEQSKTLTHQSSDPRIAFSLLLLRLGVGLVFFMWTLDKLLNPSMQPGSLSVTT